jgi:hypothetical protein
MPTSTVYTPTVSATLNGTPLTGVRKARVASSFADPVTKIYVSVYPAIDWNEGDTIAVTMGSGTNNVLSGTGTVYEADYSNSGPTFELVARGPLFAAQRYVNNVSGGLTLADLTGGPASDEALAKAVLTIAGISYNPANIGGTGLVRGILAPSAFTWKQGETALAYLARLTKASLGYRMVETIGGDVTRVQVFGRPVSTASFTLQQGVDIFGGGHTQFDAFGHYTAVTVTGYDYGDGLGPVSYSYPRSGIPAGVAPYVYQSEMIERAYDSDNGGGGGISGQTIATSFVVPEVDRVLTRVSGIKTPRDDLFEPGQTHLIDADWLGLDNQYLWCMSVTRECDDKWFSQTMEYLGGGDIPDTVIVTPVVQTTSELRTSLPPRGPKRLKDYSWAYNVISPQYDTPPPGDQLYVVPPQYSMAARARDYTGLHRNVRYIGLDAMVPGKQFVTLPIENWRRQVLHRLRYMGLVSQGMIDDVTPTVFVIPPSREM